MAIAPLLALTIDAAPVVTPAVSMDRAQQSDVLLVQDDAGAEEEGGFGYYFPFGSLDDDLHPAVDENIGILWLCFALGGPLWPGYIITGQEADFAYLAESSFSAFLHGLIELIPFPCIYIPFIGIIIFGVWFAIFEFWLKPVAYLNLYSRALHRVEGKGGKTGTGGKKRRKHPDAPDAPKPLDRKDATAPLLGRDPLATIDAGAGSVAY
jgi:hypothetical protein